MQEDILFERALQIKNPVKRDAFLDRECKTTPELRSRLAALLHAHEEPDPFFSGPPSDLAATALQSAASEPAGTTIGPYKLCEQLGEGGMGVVYAAEQKRPVRRKVAIKIIKPGMDTGQVIARFEAERQALAMMDHPNIAKVIDAGSTDAGRPYFVMELIRGCPITKYCDKARMTMQERLELFITVCDALQHAHQKGIIHRDLKPSNVMVSDIDSRPVVKVIDFGLAKALHGQSKLTNQTLHTQHGQAIGTPMYMSPEQATLSGVDIDTRSDVYSLGVLLYELISGHTPFDRDELHEAKLDEQRRMICEVEPPRPSHRLDTKNTLGSVTISERRSVDSKRLQQTLLGELDWIAMKALEKDRNRRYESTSALGQDIQRYLNDEPVLACPPSTAYRLKKFIRRNRTSLTTVCVIAATLMAATAVSVTQTIKANQQAELANAAAEQAIASEKSSKEESRIAQREAAIAKAVNEFINQDLLGGPDLGYSGYPDLKVHEVLDHVAAGIAGRLDDQPLVEAGIHSTLGRAYLALGAYDLTEAHCRRCLDLRAMFLKSDDMQVIKSRRRWAVVRGYLGYRGQALQLLKELRSDAAKYLPDNDPERLRITSSLAAAEHGLGKYGRSIVESRKILPKQIEVLGPEHEDTLFTMRLLSACMAKLGDFANAAEVDREILATIVRRYGSGESRFANLVTLRLASNLLHLPSHQNEAEQLVHRMLKITREQGGPVHEDTLYAIKTQMNLLHVQSRFDELDQVISDAQELCRQRLEENNLQTLILRSEIGALYLQAERDEEAEREFASTAELVEKAFGSAHPITVTCRIKQGLAIQNQGRVVEARVIFRELFDRLSPLGQSQTKSTVSVMNELAKNYLMTNEFPESRSVCLEALRCLESASESKSELYFECKSNLVAIAIKTNALSKAEKLSRDFREEILESFPADSRIVLRGEYAFANCIALQGRREEAIKIWRATLKQAVRSLGPEDSVTALCEKSLAATNDLEAH